MACPTCDHTMAALGYCNGGTIYHCKRCGTVNHANHFVDAPPRVYVPKLVERCRAFRKTLGADHMSQFESCRDGWVRLGIAESINVPADRPA